MAELQRQLPGLTAGEEVVLPQVSTSGNTNRQQQQPGTGQFPGTGGGQRNGGGLTGTGR